MAEDGLARAVGLLVEYEASGGASRVVGMLTEVEAHAGFTRSVGLLAEYQAAQGYARSIGVLTEYSEFASFVPVPVPDLSNWSHTWIALWQTVIINSGGTPDARAGAHFEDYTRTLLNQCITIAGGTPLGFMAYNDFVRKALAELVTASGGTAPNMYAGRWEDVIRAALVELVDATGGVTPAYFSWNDHILRLVAAVAAVGL